MSLLAFNSDHDLIRETAREFAQREATKLVARMDSTNEFPPSLLPKLAEVGLLGMPFPEEYGGIGADAVGCAVAIEELARVSAAIADVLVSVFASSGIICAYGTDEQKARFLPKIAAGESIPAYALTETQAGSDLSAIRTKAQREGDDYLLDGAKAFITLGSVADLAVALALTRPDGDPSHSMSLFVAEDFARGKPEAGMGLRGLALAGISFEHATVPAGNLIGRENEGFSLTMQSLDSGRINVAALSVGLAQGAVDEAVRYSRSREQFGRPLSKFQAIQFMVADMQTRVDAARLLTYDAAFRKDAGEPFSLQAAEAKLFASDTSMYCATESLQIHGGNGYMKDYPVERMFRDARINQIFEGTNQIQRLVISRGVYGR